MEQPDLTTGLTALPWVRCYTCGAAVGRLYQRFRDLVEAGLDHPQAFRHLEYERFLGRSIPPGQVPGLEAERTEAQEQLRRQRERIIEVIRDQLETQGRRLEPELRATLTSRRMDWTQLEELLNQIGIDPAPIRSIVAELRPIPRRELARVPLLQPCCRERLISPVVLPLGNAMGVDLEALEASVRRMSLEPKKNLSVVNPRLALQNQRRLSGVPAVMPTTTPTTTTEPTTPTTTTIAPAPPARLMPRRQLPRVEEFTTTTPDGRSVVDQERLDTWRRENYRPIFGPQGQLPVPPPERQSYIQSQTRPGYVFEFGRGEERVPATNERVYWAV